MLRTAQSWCLLRAWHCRGARDGRQRARHTTDCDLGVAGAPLTGDPTGDKRVTVNVNEGAGRRAQARPWGLPAPGFQGLAAGVCPGLWSPEVPAPSGLSLLLPLLPSSPLPSPPLLSPLLSSSLPFPSPSSLSPCSPLLTLPPITMPVSSCWVQATPNLASSNIILWSRFLCLWGWLPPPGSAHLRGHSRHLSWEASGD